MAPKRRYELSDEQWELIRSVMPRRKAGGRWNDHRTMLNGMMWVLKSGSPWRDMPERYGSWKSVYDRFRRWSADGTLDRILARLRYRLDKDTLHRLGRLAPRRQQRARASGPGGRVEPLEKNRPDEPLDHALGRSRGGWGSKLHLLTCGEGVPLAVCVTAGQAHESKSFETLMASVRPKRRRPMWVLGDKGYGYRCVRRWCEARDVWDVVPQRSDQPRREGRRVFCRATYRGRNVVERCVGWLKRSRRLGTRYEKLATHYLAMVKLAFISRYLRLLAPSDTT